MKEKIYTMPLTDAFVADDECPFCFIERKLEEHTLDFVLGPGASYMEDDVRAETDAHGFCKMHYKKMYEYGNRLGTGLIMKTHFQHINNELNQQIKMFAPSHTSFIDKFKKGKTASAQCNTSIGEWAKKSEKDCYICNFYEATYKRYIDTFFNMYRKDASFREQFLKGKGFCIPHFGDLVEEGNRILSDKEKKEFFEQLFSMMKDNYQRIYEELDWFCDKFDYRYKDADWKNSKDSLQRSMQKAAGGYPADPPYTSNR